MILSKSVLRNILRLSLIPKSQEFTSSTTNQLINATWYFTVVWHQPPMIKSSRSKFKSPDNHKENFRPQSTLTSKEIPMKTTCSQTKKPWQWPVNNKYQFLKRILSLWTTAIVSLKTNFIYSGRKSGQLETKLGINFLESSTSQTMWI